MAGAGPRVPDLHLLDDIEGVCEGHIGEGGVGEADFGRRLAAQVGLPHAQPREVGADVALQSAIVYAQSSNED